MIYFKSIGFMFVFTYGNIFYNSNLNWLLDYVNLYFVIAWLLIGVLFTLSVRRLVCISLVVMLINTAMGVFGFVLPFMVWSENWREV